MRNFQFFDYGERKFSEMLIVQDAWREARFQNETVDTIIICEHPITLTAGRRTEVDELVVAQQLAKLKEWDFYQLDRGGRLTLHAPGQFVLYPVLSLVARKWGVREYILRGLSAIASILNDCGVPAQISLDPMGVWVNGRKIASAGVRVVRGITLHGFSVNIANDLNYYKLFSPCGLLGAVMTSVSQEGGDVEVSREFFAEIFARYIFQQQSYLSEGQWQHQQL